MSDVTKMTDAELNAAVAEKVMGWTHLRGPECFGDPCGVPPTASGLHHPIPNYSTDIAAAWKVVERMLNANPADSIARWRFDLRLIADQFFVSFNNRLGSDGSSAGHDPAKVTRAICLAALAAVEAKEKTNA